MLPNLERRWSSDERIWSCNNGYPPSLTDITKKSTNADSLEINVRLLRLNWKWIGQDNFFNLIQNQNN